MPYKFDSASPSEEIVYGACRPCHHRFSTPEDRVIDWIRFMISKDIERVCCLLDGAHLKEYDSLLSQYREMFGDSCVCHAPIKDFSTVDQSTFYDRILPFLDQADNERQRVVVHCSAGSGRTGHILALWLHTRRDFDLPQAVKTIEQTGRNPLEATTLSELRAVAQG